MIIVNGERLNVEAPKTEIEKWVSEKFQEIRATRKEVIFNKPIRHDGVGGLGAAPTTFEMVAIRRDPKTGADQKWILSTGSPKYQNGRMEYQPNWVRVHDDLRLDVKDNTEKAFFLYYIMQKHMGHMGFILRDYEDEAIKENERLAEEMAVGNLILTDLSDDAIKLRCYAWGVLDVENKSIPILKKALREKVRVSEMNKRANNNSGKGYKEFIEEAKTDSESLKLTAYVTKAFDDNVLTFEKATLKVSYKGGNHNLCIVPATMSSQYIDYTARFLLSDKNAKEVFLTTIGSSIDSIASTSRDYKNITSNATLRKIAKEDYGLDVEIGMKNADIIAMIDDHLSN